MREGIGAPGIILPVSHRQPDPAPGAQPERGFVVAVLAPGVDAREELGELGELSATAGVGVSKAMSARLMVACRVAAVILAPNRSVT